MDRTKLMQDLDAAVDAVGTKWGALATAQVDAAQAIDAARGHVAAATKEHQDAVDAAQELRRQLETELNSALPTDPGGVVVNQ